MSKKKNKKKEKVDERLPTPGAGVDPNEHNNPTKRLKAEWRREGRPGSLKSYARRLAGEGDERAKRWFYNKSSESTLEAREDKKARVRAGQKAAASKKKDKS